MPTDDLDYEPKPNKPKDPRFLWLILILSFLLVATLAGLVVYVMFHGPPLPE
jgi:hypothetical protein